MIILFKYCADVKNCENFRGFGLFKYCVNIVLTWKIVRTSEASVLYILAFNLCNAWDIPNKATSIIEAFFFLGCFSFFFPFFFFLIKKVNTFYSTQFKSNVFSSYNTFY